MRLSYSFDLDTDNKQRIFKELLAENRVEFDESSGNIFIDTSEEHILHVDASSVASHCQGIAIGRAESTR